MPGEDSWIMDNDHFPPIAVVCLFKWVSFAAQKMFSFMRSLLLTNDLNAIRLLFKKSFPVPVSSSIFLTFSSTKLRVSGFRLFSLIHLELSFVRDKGLVSLFYMQLFRVINHLLKMSSFIQYVFLATFFPKSHSFGLMYI